MKNCRVNILENCGHRPHAEQPGLVNEIIQRFIRGNWGHLFLDTIDCVCFHVVIRDRLDGLHLNWLSKSLGDELLRTNLHTFYLGDRFPKIAIRNKWVIGTWDMTNDAEHNLLVRVPWSRIRWSDLRCIYQVFSRYEVHSRKVYHGRFQSDCARPRTAIWFRLTIE